MKFVRYLLLIQCTPSTSPWRLPRACSDLRLSQRDRSKWFAQVTNWPFVSKKGFSRPFSTSRGLRRLILSSMHLRYSTRQAFVLLALSGVVPMLLGMAFLSDFPTLQIQDLA